MKKKKKKKKKDQNYEHKIPINTYLSAIEFKKQTTK